MGNRIDNVSSVVVESHDLACGHSHTGLACNLDGDLLVSPVVDNVGFFYRRDV